MRLLLPVLVLAACTDTPGPGLGGSTRTAKMEIPLGGTNQLDVLFVIDNSPAMAGKTEKVAAHMTAFANVMSTLVGGVPDLHVGVTTSDVGTVGNDGSTGGSIGADGQGGCSGAGDAGRLRVGGASVLGSFLSDLASEGARLRNYTGEMGAALVQMANVGTSGCAFPRPLEATVRALAKSPANAGFLRADAYLAVIHIAAGDDCSFGAASFLAGASTTDTSRCQGPGLVDTAAFVSALRGLKTDPTKVVVTEITAAEAPRLHAFAAGFPNRNEEASLLDPDPANAFELLSTLQKVTLGLPCWDAPLADLDPVAPGLQAECAGELRTQTQTLALKVCAPGLESPCFQLVDEPVGCTQTGLSTRLAYVEGYRSTGALAVIECLVEASP